MNAYRNFERKSRTSQLLSPEVRISIQKFDNMVKFMLFEITYQENSCLLSLCSVFTVLLKIHGISFTEIHSTLFESLEILKHVLNT